MRRFFLILLIMCTAAGFAQTVQKVKVLEYRGEKGKKPLSQVEVVVGNAAPAVSDENGLCTLNFRTLQPGDKILVRRMVRPGYVVFNQDALDEWYVTGGKDELVLVMCQQALIMELREKYKSAISASLDKNYEAEKQSIIKKYQEGKMSAANYESEMSRLYYELADRMDEFDAYLDRFVYIDVQEINELEKKALDLIANGDVRGAIKLYDSEKMVENLQEGHKTLAELTNAAADMKSKVAEQKAQRDKAYEQVKRHVALLRLQGGANNINRSVKLLHDVAYADTTNYPVLLDYATYCNKIDNYSEAEAALRYCTSAPDTIVRIQADIVQSNINSRRHKYSENKTILERSVRYLKLLSEERNAPTLYLGMRVRALISLVSTYNNLRDVEGAARSRQELLECAYRLYDQTQDNKAKRLLVEALYYSYYGLGIFGDNNSQQLIGFSEAIRLQEELYKDDPVAQTAMLAFLHTAISSTYSRIAKKNGDGDFSRVIAERQLAIDLYEEAYPKNPKAYVGYLGSAYRSLANVYIEQLPEEVDKAMPLLEKAEKYILEEQVISPEVSTSRIAALNFTYVLYYNIKKDYEMCEKYAEKSLSDYLQLYETSPKQYASTVKSLYKYLLNSLNQNPTKNAEKIEKYRKRCEEFGK